MSVQAVTALRRSREWGGWDLSEEANLLASPARAERGGGGALAFGRRGFLAFFGTHSRMAVVHAATHWVRAAADGAVGEEGGVRV
jgi:hypothetical protein